MQQTLSDFGDFQKMLHRDHKDKKFKQRKDAKSEHQYLQWSMEVQQLYEQGNVDEKKRIFEKEISQKIDEFIQDKYNHYVIQCVLQHGLQEHKNRIFSFINQKKHLYWKRKYAYKILQLAISDKSNQERENILNFIKKNIDQMKYDQYGNLIVGHMINQIENQEEFKQIVDNLDIDKIKYHQYGCLVVISILQLNNPYHLPIQQIINEIINQLITDSLELSKSVYSNYVVQKLLLSSSLDYNKKLLNDFLIPNFVQLAQDKYGSNVCEKVLEVALAYQFQYLWTNLLRNNFHKLINDKYANYVMQTFYYHIQLFNYIQDEFQNLINEIANRIIHPNNYNSLINEYKLQMTNYYQNHFEWPTPNRNELMSLSTLRNDYPNKHQRSISQDYKYVPEQKQLLTNKESYANRCDDLQIRNPKKLNIIRQSMQIEDIPGTKPQIADFQSKTKRHINPLEPIYQIPTYKLIPPPQPNKFLRDTLNISDIPGTEIRIKIKQPRKDNPFTEIEGTKPKIHYLSKPPRVQQSFEESIHHHSIQRHLDPLQPSYHWDGQNIGKIDGAQPMNTHVNLNKEKSLSLNTRDINGAQANTIKPIPKESSKITNNTQDIYKAQGNTIQRGIKTLRQTNPLQPSYQLPGNQELYNL